MIDKLLNFLIDLEEDQDHADARQEDELEAEIGLGGDHTDPLVGHSTVRGRENAKEEKEKGSALGRPGNEGRLLQGDHRLEEGSNYYFLFSVYYNYMKVIIKFSLFTQMHI